MKKILIIRFSSIGDIVLTTPIIRCLYEQLPGAEIHYLTKEKFHKILEANPYIHKTHLFRDDLKGVIKTLKKEHFDFVVDLHRNIRSARVKMALRKPSGTFDKLNYEKWLRVNFKTGKLPDIHIVDRYFAAVKELNVRNDGQGLDYFIPDEDLLTHNDLPGIYSGGFVALVVGAMHYTKMMPEERLMELCGMIDKPVILLGGPDDHARAQRIASVSSERIYNACGSFNINQSASLISLAGKVITHDTGLMHIASAFRKEIYSLWGNTIPEFGMYPYLPAGEGKSVIMQTEGLSCRPCSKIGFAKCPKKHFKCMMDIDLDKLSAMINE